LVSFLGSGKCCKTKLQNLPTYTIRELITILSFTVRLGHNPNYVIATT
jgi:hypothetical protein